MNLLLQPNSKGHAGGTAPVKNILPFLTSAERTQLFKAAPEGIVVAYGKSAVDRTKWERIRHGDPVLFYHHWVYFAESRVALKTKNAKLCRYLWGKTGQYEGELHDMILLYSTPRPTHISAKELNKAIGYAAGYVLRPFQAVPITERGRITQLLKYGQRAADGVAKNEEQVFLNEGVDEALEGRAYLVEHLKKERSRGLRDAKRKEVLQRTGRLACEVCGFDAREKYPWLALDFAEVHHTRPLSASTRTRKTRLEDLAILCANCHRMIHRTSPILSVRAFRDKLS